MILSLNNAARYAVMALFLFLALFGVYKIWSWGNTHGQTKIQKEWDQAKEAQAKAIQLQKDLNSALEAGNKKATEEATHALAEQNTKHQVELANAQSEFDRRLLQSEKRADVYKRMSQAGTTERGNLASHAAQLDRSLEQGRQLVRELRETLRFRDEQLKAVSAKLVADRKLLTNSDDADGRQNSTSHK